MTVRNAILVSATLVLALFAWSWWRERTPALTTDQAVAAERTAGAVVMAQKAETVFVERKAAAVAARTVVRARIDTVLEHLTDTVQVKELVTDVRTLLVKDSTASAAGDSALAAEQRLTASVRAELRLALNRREPRLRVTVAGLFDPIAMVPAASATASFRMFGNIALITRADHRLAPLEPTRSRLYAGVQYTF